MKRKRSRTPTLWTGTDQRKTLGTPHMTLWAYCWDKYRPSLRGRGLVRRVQGILASHGYQFTAQDLGREWERRAKALRKARKDVRTMGRGEKEYFLHSLGAQARIANKSWETL